MNTDSVTPPRTIVALDFPTTQQALDLSARLDPALCRLKVGKELFTLGGPQLVERLQHDGFSVFLDLKFHDIPNTVAGACRAATSLGVWMVNVHASGGRRMLEAAREAVVQAQNPPLLIGVTVLTSMAQEDLNEIGIQVTPEQQVQRLAGLTQQAGLDGVVCSPLEAGMIREQCGESFLRVTPGVRLAGAAGDDQRRVMTPARAIEGGASYLVVGRPVTQADDPIAVLEQINAEIA